MNFSASEVIAATLSMYLRAGRETTLTLRHDWKLLVASVALFLAFTLCGFFLAPLGMVGGVLMSLLGLAALAYYYGWLQELVRSSGPTRRSRLGWASLREFDVGLFFGLVSISFILWVAEWMVGSLILGMNADWMKTLLALGILFVFNALPEVLYIHRYESLPAFQEAFRFTIANWIEWYIPFIAITSPFLLLGFVQFPLFFAMNSPLLPVAMVFQVPQLLLPPGLGILAALGGVVLANWFMLFRGFLFQELESGTRRQRIFANRQK